MYVYSLIVYSYPVYATNYCGYMYACKIALDIQLPVYVVDYFVYVWYKCMYVSIYVCTYICIHKGAIHLGIMVMI